jgi:hypothetical protein
MWLPCINPLWHKVILNVDSAHIYAPLVITPEVLERLKNLSVLAFQHPVDIQVLMVSISDAEKKKLHLEQMNKQTIKIPGIWNFYVTLSIETNQPCGTCRHMSMSIARDGRVPSPEAVWMIAAELGFTGDSIQQADSVYVEDLSDGGRAVNILQRIVEKGFDNTEQPR